MGDAAKNPFVLPIFDTNYTVDLVWPAGDTIDVGMLKKVIISHGTFLKILELEFDCQRGHKSSAKVKSRLSALLSTFFIKRSPSLKLSPDQN